MKRILSLIVVFLFSLLLVACNDKQYDEPKDNTKFKDYLVEDLNTIDSSKVDERFGKITAPSLKDIKVKNTQITYDVSEDGYSEETGVMNVWEDSDNYYLYADDELFKLAKSDIEESFETEYEGKKVSKAINSILESTGLDIDLDDLLDCVEFTIDDFEETDEKNVYLLKNDSIANFVASLCKEFGSDVSKKDVKEALKEFKKFECYVIYGNGKIRTVKFDIEYKQDVMKLAGTFGISFLYDQEIGIVGLKFDVDMTMKQEKEVLLGVTGFVTVSNSLFETDLTASGLMLEEEIDAEKIYVNAKLTNEELTAKSTITFDGEKVEVLNAKLTIADNFVTGGNIKLVDPDDLEDEISIEITSGKKVTIPDVDYDDAIDLNPSIVGDWKFESMTMGYETYRVGDETPIGTLTSDYIVFTFEKDGTGKAVMTVYDESEETAFEWEKIGDAWKVTIDGEDAKAEIINGKLVISMGDGEYLMSYTLVRK